MFGRSIRIARVAGIPVGISPWWLVIVAFFTWMLGSTYFPEAVHGIAPATSYALGLASVLLLFASLLAHEFGHAIVARRHGVEVEEIDLWLLGGVSKMRGEAHEPGVELRYALAGPAVSALITACFGALVLALPSSLPATVLAVVEYQFLINALILGFNLMPAFPLDGGRVLRALLWRRMGAMQRATEIAARVGRAFGYLLVGLGLLLVLSAYSYDGLWLAFIGFFIVMAAGQQAAGAEIRAVFAGTRAAELMTHPVVSIPADSAVDLAVQEYFGRYPFTAFPVVDAHGRARGLITIERIRQAALGARSDASRATALAERVGDLAEDDPALLVGEGADVAGLLERPAFARTGRAVVVGAGGAPAGMISITDVQRTIRSARLRSQGARPARPT
jgi:Zn-dependent protease/CBS domain-containing protein